MCVYVCVCLNKCLLGDSLEREILSLCLRVCACVCVGAGGRPGRGFFIFFMPSVLSVTHEFLKTSVTLLPAVIRVFNTGDTKTSETPATPVIACLRVFPVSQTKP